MRQSLHDAWWRLATQDHPRTITQAVAAAALETLAVPYGAVTALRNVAYDVGWARAVPLPCRVVSVGNLTVGGTGKTACVELIAEKLRAEGQPVAVLSRGYGGTTREYWLRWEAGRLVVGGLPSADGLSLADEPQILAQRLEGVPVLVGARRDRTGHTACREFHAKAVVLDDGFQHRRVRRDCDIVLVHARMPFGGWRLLPRGPMREPIVGLRRADVVIITKADEALGTLGALRERLRALNPSAALVTAVHAPAALRDLATGQRADPRTLAGQRVGLVSSIGDPEGFDATVRRLQATVLWHKMFPDHHPYGAADWETIRAQAKQGRPAMILTTEKDWVRLAPVAQDLGGVPLNILSVRMQILDGEADLDARLVGR